MIQRLLLMQIVLPRGAVVVVAGCTVVMLLTPNPAVVIGGTVVILLVLSAVVVLGDGVFVMPELELAVTVEGVVVLTPYSAL